MNNLLEQILKSLSWFSKQMQVETSKLFKEAWKRNIIMIDSYKNTRHSRYQPHILYGLRKKNQKKSAVFWHLHRLN